MRALTLRHCKADPHRDGGTKRSSQINELLRNSNVQLEELVLPLNLRGYRQLRRLQIGAMKAGLIELRHGVKVAYRTIRDCSLIHDKIQEAEIDMIIWEGTLSPSPKYFSNRHPLIAFPQNLESLTPCRIDFLNESSLTKALSLEAERLSTARAVFCISREEQFLLTNMGLPAFFLPYFPPKEFLDNLMVVRENRLETVKKNAILVIGSASNLVTRSSIIELLRVLDERRNPCDVEYIVCGSGTDLLGYKTQGNTKILGRVSDQCLYTLLGECSAALIYQKTGAGALTRITELLVAGVPVVANDHSARSIAPANGLVVCRNLSEMLDACESKQFTAQFEFSSESVYGLHNGIEDFEKKINEIS